ncbi:MAG: phosphoenolpyruvate carboxylase [Sphingopyxis sp.]|nr:phosphoenolpyruvate carboxylase [Sphingopyxis sp.]
MPDRLKSRLNALHRQTAETPLFNPVFQLGLELSRELESGTLQLHAVDGMIEELGCEALQMRAHRLNALVGPVDADDNHRRFSALVQATAAAADFRNFAAIWQRPLQHIVFTGHPTFLLTTGESDAVAIAASTDDVGPAMCIVDPPREPITLAKEHREVLSAMRHAHAARDAMVRTIHETAITHWPDEAANLSPVPFRFASWVGYDMDGRTDIGWSTSIRHRLQEKAERLAVYGAALSPYLSDLALQMHAAEAHSRSVADAFAGDMTDPATMSAAANQLTADHPAKLLTLAPAIATIRTAAREALAAGDAERGAALLTIASSMVADGLGMGWIHFRVNSAQLLNAIRRRIDPDNMLDLSGGVALARLRELIQRVRPLRSNFAALAIETTTAVRQFLAMAQIIHHIDGDAPIRMLIAECEEPQTVLAALYFAKLFGIADRVDVSPLFETESALEHGGRFLAALLREPGYQDYVRARGRVAIQTGFSDAGRFIGQVPAALAIERLHGWLANTMAANGLTDVAALVFNTHGESIGRGAHPSGMLDRLTYPMSRWARARYTAAGITLEPEVSFQGGDGFLAFRTPDLAVATLTRIAEVERQLATEPAQDDAFYTQTDLSLDFYRGIRRMQRDFLASRSYARAITAFGLGLLNETGSRKSRRQSDLAADREMSLRQIRAIPHNAILQQLGYPVNVIAGAGSAAAEEMEAIAALMTSSARGQQLMRLVRASNTLASIKTVAAYGELFNSAYWASRPYRGDEPALETACLALAEHLVGDDRVGAFRRLASRLRIDGVKLHRLLERAPIEGIAKGPKLGREDQRRSLGALHAIRLALMQHIFLRAVQVPAFSRSNDISRDDVLAMVFSLRVEEALAQLRRAFPVTEPRMSDFAVDDPSDYPDDAGQAYARIHSDFIEPIAHAHRLILRISTAIANHFGAHG